MKRSAKLDKNTANRSKRLGNVGEELTKPLLENNNFVNIQDLNQRRKNYPFADYFAERDGKKYVISVKMRNKYEFTHDGTKRLNSRYKLGSNCYPNAEKAKKQNNAIAAWLTISLDLELKTYSAYFGLLSSLKGGLGVNMSEKAICSYECLAKNNDVPPSLNLAELKNVYEEAE